jgi:hypothetical protein
MLKALIPLLSLSFLGATLAADPAGYQCKCGPTDSCWPTAANWAELNATVEGTLIEHIPPAAACYESGFKGASTFNKARCDEVTAKWTVDEQWL